jgi:hypothetical protein
MVFMTISPIVVSMAIGLIGTIHLRRLRDTGAMPEVQERAYGLYFSIFLFISKFRGGERGQRPTPCGRKADRAPGGWHVLVAMARRKWMLSLIQLPVYIRISEL